MSEYTPKVSEPKVIGGSSIAFCEDTSYKTQIWCQTNLEKSLEYRHKLYKVTLADTSVVFVLAKDVERAIGQASCRDNSYLEQRPLEVGATAIPVNEFKIQGWGRANFNAD